MTFFESLRTEPEYNLALEEFLCRRAARDGGAFFMLWRNAPSVIIGRFQDMFSEVDTAFAAARHIPVVRRNSGGGAVYHDLGNVNYSFILPDRREPGGNPAPDYGFGAFAEKVIGALASAGVAAEFSQSGNDITAGGRKISGMAQFRHNGVLLCHGTLLFDCDMKNMAHVLNVTDEKLRRHGVRSVRSRVGNLKPLLSGVADTETFMALLRKSFRGEGETLDLSALDEEAVRRLMEKKYRSRAWNEEGRCEEPGLMEAFPEGRGEA
ncbi:MAG: lipoate--protein ligase family protein [Fretibacterium sp.]|nr:lipoate--protein ligase family protein [Fretibacterium sp.]